MKLTRTDRHLKQLSRQVTDLYGQSDRDLGMVMFFTVLLLAIILILTALSAMDINRKSVRVNFIG